MGEIKTEVYLAKDLTVHTASGEIHAQDIIDAIKASYFSGVPTQLVLWNFLGAKGSTLYTEDVEKIASAMRDLAASMIDRPNQRIKTALVHAVDVYYGLARMYEGIAGSMPVLLSIEYSVFRELAPALEWLDVSSGSSADDAG